MIWCSTVQVRASHLLILVVNEMKCVLCDFLFKKPRCLLMWCLYSLSCRGLIRVSVIAGGVEVLWWISRCYTPHSCTGVFVL